MECRGQEIRRGPERPQEQTAIDGRGLPKLFPGMDECIGHSICAVLNFGRMPFFLKINLFFKSL